MSPHTYINSQYPSKNSIADFSKVVSSVGYDQFYELGLEIQCPIYGTYVLIHSHCLPSFVLLVRLIIRDIGIPASNITIVPKIYSSVPKCLEELRGLGCRVSAISPNLMPGGYDEFMQFCLKDECEKFAARVRRGRGRRRVIIVDDGGMITTHWYQINKNSGTPIESISIQQTTSGILRKPLASEIIKIDVARSAAKKLFESPIIAQGVVRKINNLNLDLSGKTVGVVGVGAIGLAVHEALTNLSKIVIAYDKAIERYPGVDMVARRDLMHRSDVVFGCTGYNWTESFSGEYIFSGKTFISCTSRDVEYKKLLKKFGSIKDVGSIRDVALEVSPPSVVLNSGFPINFDRINEWESLSEISITRALIKAAILYAIFIPIRLNVDRPIMLAPEIQKEIFSAWRSIQEPLRGVDILYDTSNIDDVSWWRNNSAGSVDLNIVLGN